MYRKRDTSFGSERIALNTNGTASYKRQQTSHPREVSSIDWISTGQTY